MTKISSQPSENYDYKSDEDMTQTEMTQTQMTQKTINNIEIGSSAEN